MKAISIQQPWAWLIVRPDLTDPVERAAAARSGELKDVENRVWRAPLRGRVLVHAGKREDRDGLMWLVNNWSRYGLPAAVGDMWDKLKDGKLKFDLGGIVGETTITACVRDYQSVWAAQDQWNFVLADSRPLPFRPLKGALGFFEVPDA